MEVLKQGVNSPLDVEKQITIIYAGTNGYLNEIPVNDVRRYETELYDYVVSSGSKLFEMILETKKMTEDVKAEMESVLTKFKDVFKVSA